MDATSTRTAFTPTSPLHADETIVDRFVADKGTYWRENAWLAAIAMALGMATLWIMGNPHIWTGAVGGLAAVAVRALYLASDEVKMEWHLTDQRLLGPGPRAVPLDQIAKVNRLFSAAQVVTAGGDKHLIKYQADAAGVQARLRSAAGGAE